MSCSTLHLERVLFALAGTMTLTATLLGAFVNPWFLLLAGFVGLNQWLYAAIGDCPASALLGRTPCFVREESR